MVGDDDDEKMTTERFGTEQWHHLTLLHPQTLKQ